MTTSVLPFHDAWIGIVTLPLHFAMILFCSRKQTFSLIFEYFHYYFFGDSFFFFKQQTVSPLLWTGAAICSEDHPQIQDRLSNQKREFRNENENRQKIISRLSESISLKKKAEKAKFMEIKTRPCFI
eukprot:TRINITY_DN3343_c0_g1_i1.p2 TRINITY_DN3343_c0_g1~~TRINITY_DN3343_c0_g1_i1.p2  ORF type:complete len:127 (-),score=20.77 TRINITY_DN3343_c0_g1_i1:245-625(-)